MLSIVKNFEMNYKEDNMFREASKEDLQRISDLLGDKVDKVIEFYSKYEPYNLPALDSYVSLLSIDDIIVENTDGEPGMYLSKYGVFVFSVTLGGNVLLIDTNDNCEGDASVLLADSSMFYYDYEDDMVQLMVPDSVEDKFTEPGIIYLNYENLKKSTYKFEDSFLEFMKKLSNNEYPNIEKFLL